MDRSKLALKFGQAMVSRQQSQFPNNLDLTTILNVCFDFKLWRNSQKQKNVDPLTPTFPAAVHYKEKRRGAVVLLTTSWGRSSNVDESPERWCVSNLWSVQV